MKIPFHSSKRYRVVIIVSVVVAVLLVVGLCGIHYWEYRRDIDVVTPTPDADQGLSQVIVDGQRYELNDNIESVLVLGIDKFDDDTWGSYINNQQADAIMLAVFDHDAKAYSILQINRDTMTEIETLGVTGESGGTITAQLALAHAYGTGNNDSARNVVHAVSDLLYGVDIQHFISLKMDAIPILNDAVGGVQVELLDDFTTVNSSYTKGSVVTLHGDEALLYIRARESMEEPTNISRMERQRQYMMAWSDAYMAARETNEDLTASMVADVGDYFITDMTVSMLEDMGEQIEMYTFNGIITVEGESVVGADHMEFYVDEAALQAQVLELFYRTIE